MDHIVTEMVELKGITTCAITLAQVKGELPRHLLSGEQECAYLYRDGMVEELYYSRVLERDGHRSILYETDLLLPVQALTDRFRSCVGEKIRELSRAMQAVPRSFFQNERGVIPTWRIYFVETGGVLLLPEKVSNLILNCASQEDRQEHMHRYHIPDVHSPFALCHQLTQLLYYGLAGFAPFEPEEVKLSGYRHIPTYLAVTSLDRASADAIDAILSMPLSKQREAVSSAYSASENLEWFDSHCPDISAPEALTDEQQTRLGAYRQQLAVKGQRREFWRRKGFGIIAASVALILIIGVSVQAIRRAAEPPYTAGMSQTQIIEEFYLAQNLLDITKMNASLARGVKNPFEQEVTTLFVNSRVRQAYEGIDSVLSPQEFEQEGRKALERTVLLYGVTDLTITETGRNTYLADYILFTPDSSSSQDMPEIYRGLEVAVQVEFTISEKKDYYQISGIREIGHSVVREFEIPYER